MKKKVLVIGEYGIDRFVYGKIERINPEAPTPVLVPVSTKENLGMAGNVFENLRSLKKFEVDFLRSTTPAIKTRYVDEKSNYILLRVDENDTVARIEKIDESYISSFDAVVISDYNKGFLDAEDIRVIAGYSKLCFMDTKKSFDLWCYGIDWIKINEKEFNNPKHSQSTMDGVKESLIVTLGGEGSMYMGKKFPTEKTSVIDVVGAGDTFMSAFVCAILENKSPEESILFANKCSTEAVKRRGVSLLGDILKEKPNL
jgi:D-beta-D-heptose 7-phosphate kinase/D-beta-D-heptose 1-phosphate adenosyltransferase